jgi:hypothetical protein
MNESIGENRSDVIPAQAGIQKPVPADPRLRGGDIGKPILLGAERCSQRCFV